MKKNLLTIGVLAISMTASAQVLTHVGDAGLLYVGEGALVYSGGGVQTQATGLLDVHGNVMVVGGGADLLKTIDALGAAKTDGGNMILRMNSATALDDATTYGQLYIDGITQTNSTAIISKEYRTAANGSGNYFQQVALPFYDKEISTLSTELGKTFGTTRWTQNEILKFDNTSAVSVHYTSLATKTTDPSGYYMLGSKSNNLNTSTTLRTLNGRAYASVPAVTTLADGNVTYGTNGNNTNTYGEKYNTYLQDQFALASGLWIGRYAKDLYQFGNPYFTNLDLSYIAIDEGVTGDGNKLDIYGIKTTAGTVTTLSNASTYATGATFVTFDAAGIPAGDIPSLIIKPMHSFVLKLRSYTSATFNFNTLRRFKATTRYSVSNAAYSVTASKNTTNGTLKQLGVIALNASGEELGRTYYVVSPDFTTGHQNATIPSVQVANGAGVIGTFEEDPINGMYDANYTSAYWLYINEANETNFFGKPVPLALYNSDIASLKFEIRENAVLIPDTQQNLSTNEAFYYRTSTGVMAPISQNMSIPTNGGTEFGLSYGPMSNSVLGTSESIKEANKTLVVYNEAIDHYVIQFDPKWKSADIQVYDMSGKIVISAKNVKTSQDFVLDLSNKIQGTYVVTGVNEKGEKFTSKIIR